LRCQKSFTKLATENKKVQLEPITKLSVNNLPQSHVISDVIDEDNRTASSAKVNKEAIILFFNQIYHFIGGPSATKPLGKPINAAMQ
jgi:hypothetical protein